MVIQRWQTLLLLLAVAMVAIFSLTPYATYQAEASKVPLYVADAPALLTITVTAGILLLLNIFMYKNLKRQMTITILSIVLLIATAVTAVIVALNAYPGAEFVIVGGLLLLLVAVVFALAAYRFMQKDFHLLRSYDRLR